MFSAAAARGAGAKRVLILERDDETGGILNQCIHSGFGLHMFKEELTGPEYAERAKDMLANTGIEIMTGTMVLSVTADKTVTAISPNDGRVELSANAIVLCMGCRERTAGAIGLAGSRPAGVFTAGAAQRLINIDGYMVGRKICILGSGDIGLVMARRMVLEGAEVAAVFELMPYSSGLKRNIAQCLDDYGIPLYLSHTVTAVKGRERVEGVWVSQVDGDRKPIPGTEKLWECDTLLLSVGLIPENELSRAAGIEIDSRTGGIVVYENRETSIPGIFAAGNAVHVHDLADFASAEAAIAGVAAALYSTGKTAGKTVEIIAGEGVSYTVPQKIRPENLDKRCDIFFRIRSMFENAVIDINGKETHRGHMSPGEMARVVLPKEYLENCGSVTIKVVER
jgi:NADPH-dependent 2,4-dienoyl-CoA reductase/sulfur reductase-like enzyme